MAKHQEVQKTDRVKIAKEELGKESGALYNLAQLPLLVREIVRQRTDRGILIIEGQTNIMNDRNPRVDRTALVTSHQILEQVVNNEAGGEKAKIQRPDMQAILEDVFGPLTNVHSSELYELAQPQVSSALSQKKKITEYVEPVYAAADRQVATLQKKKQMDAVELVHSLFAEAVPRTLLNTDKAPQEYQDASVAVLKFLAIEVAHANAENMPKLMSWLLQQDWIVNNIPKVGLGQRDRHANVMKSFLRKMYQDHTNPDPEQQVRYGVVSNLFDSYADVAADEEELLDLTFKQLNGLEHAGINTVAVTTEAALAFFGQNPVWFAKAKAEVAALSEQDLNFGESYYKLFNKTPHTTAAFLEALRLVPAQDVFLRQVFAETMIKDDLGNNVVLEKDTLMYISLFGIHTDKNYLATVFEKMHGRKLIEKEFAQLDPNKFMPEFWGLEQKKEEEREVAFKKALDSIDAFGRGAHMCLGRNLAMFEGVLSLVRLFKQVPDLQIESKPDFVKYGLSTEVKRGAVKLSTGGQK